MKSAKNVNSSLPKKWYIRGSTSWGYFHSKSLLKSIKINNICSVWISLKVLWGILLPKTTMRPSRSKSVNQNFCRETNNINIKYNIIVIMHYSVQNECWAAVVWKVDRTTNLFGELKSSSSKHPPERVLRLSCGVTQLATCMSNKATTS